MKENIVIPTLIFIAFIYNAFTLPAQTSILTSLAALAVYGMTGVSGAALLILVVVPVYFLLTDINQLDGFHNDGAKEVSERVKGIVEKKANNNEPTGVLEVDTFATLAAPVYREGFEDTSGNVASPLVSSTLNDGAPKVTVPQYVKDQGMRIIFPTLEDTPLGTIESVPMANPVRKKDDNEATEAALAPNAASLPASEQPISAQGYSNHSGY
jgi:hypothetical protein